ncbi:UNVERIFIED_CONTAM: putative TPR repeat-containing protein [Sesamum calycinum]|uniref:TPR repeat-containing protein n=1 Tax=Sesamum calycinum TaxID=2727403 RepID=A0AAW2QN83_9LAMI
MTTRGSRSEKVKRIFQQFDTNRDGGLNREEMAALVVAVNPRVKFSDEQISAILDEVFRTYGEFIDGEKGLTFDGLLRTYDDGAGDVDRDFDALGLELKPLEDKNGISQASEEAASSSSVADERVMEPHKKQRTAAWAASPNHGIVFDDTWKLVDDLEILIKRLKAKQLKDGKIKNDNSDVFSDPGWSRELGPSTEISDKRVIWNESGPDYAAFVKELGVLRSRADRARSRAEAFDGQMAIGRVLYEHYLFKEALSWELFVCAWRHSEAKGEFLLALEAAEAGGNQWAYLLPQIHVNLGIALEAEAVKALEEAIYMKNDYADAHCDLASALHAMGDDENAIKEFQKAIDLKPGHVDALYNLGGLYMDMGRYQRASEMYTRVLGVWPNHWRAQLNKAVSLLGAGETEEAKKALKEALKMTNRVELHDAISHLKQLQKRKLRGNGNGNGEAAFITVEPSKFKIVGEKTTLRTELTIALDIRAFQRITRLNRCEVELIKKEMSEGDVPVSYSGSGVPEKSIRKASLEGILCKLLNFLKPETFVGAVKSINQKILAVLDDSESGRVDLGMFFAVLAPLCGGSPDKRKQIAYESLLWRPVNEGNTQIKKSDAQRYIKLLRAIYIPSHGISEILEIHGETDNSLVSLTEFVTMFDDPEWGFSIMSTLLKLETGDRSRHGRHVCATCRYPIIGSRFKEMKSHFSLCSQCYCEGKVPSSCKQEEYRFKEYANEAEAVKDKCLWFGSKGSSPAAS